uniref:Alpha-1,3-glucosyltransferase n=1 Tax=Cannabis sativa TaxID=3483 RepID=A0A803Q4J1_CANSA
MEEESNQRNPISGIWWFFAIATCLKLLLIPSYHSTDFEVHRNWLAITNSLPISQWYSDETSPWTLDYPPFFAYFERFLSIFAKLIDPQIVDLQKGLNYNSNTRGFLRGFRQLSAMGTVVVAVFVAAFGPFLYYGQIQQVISRMFPFGRGLCHAYWAPNFWVLYIILDKGLAFFLRKLGFNIQTPTASFTGGVVGDSSPFAVLPRITPFTTFLMVLLALCPCLIQVWRNPQPKKNTRWVAYAYMCGFLFGWHVHEKASLHFVIPLAIVAVQSTDMDDAKHYFILSIVSCYSLFPLLYESQEYPIKVVLLLLHSILMWLGFSAPYQSGRTVKTRKEVKTSSSSTLAMEEGGFSIGVLEKSYLIGIIVVEIWGQFLHPLVLGDKFPFIPLIYLEEYHSAQSTKPSAGATSVPGSASATKNVP